VHRRTFLQFACACGAACASALPVAAAAQGTGAWTAPKRFDKPDLTGEEGGLWGLMDREESKLRRSPFLIRDAGLQAYVQAVACRLAGEHCPDIRVHVVHTPVFNASMAPNGMMQVWSGLLLRVENEAQLAAVLGHEIAHYLERHSLENLRDVKSRSAFAQVLGMFGAAGSIGQLAVVAGMLGHSRDQERTADSISVQLMSNAGYDPGEAAKIWENLLMEIKARPDRDPIKSSPLFASHPPADERKENLTQLASTLPTGNQEQKSLEDHVRPFRAEWLADEVKRGQHAESIALFSRMLLQNPMQADVLYSRAEVRRLRAQSGDFDNAVVDLRMAVSIGGEPPEAYRSLGMIFRSRRQFREARQNFNTFLERAPQAPDAAMIKSYLGEMGS
jgi:predicted Zn-dependent protease